MTLKADYLEHMHRNLTSLVVSKEDFYTAPKRHSRLLFPRDFMARNQHLLEIKTLKKSDMNFCVMKSSSDLNCVQLVKLHFLKEFEVVIWRVGVSGGCQRHLHFGLLAPNVTAFLVPESLPNALAFCHGCVPGSGPVFSG